MYVCVCTQEAIDRDARNPLARYERAAVLCATNAHAQALKDYEELAKLAPQEASVYMQVR